MYRFVNTALLVAVGVGVAMVLHLIALSPHETQPGEEGLQVSYLAQDAEAKVSAFQNGTSRSSNIVLASHDDAIVTEKEAEDHAVAEIDPAFKPSNPVARLLPAKGVGEWLGRCRDWPGNNPYWLVGVETTGQPQFDGEEIVGSWMGDGVYVILSANSGQMVGFGTLNSSNRSYASIANLSNANLTITYKTPTTLDGAGVDTAPAPVGMATIEALPTNEAICRATEWAP